MVYVAYVPKNGCVNYLFNDIYEHLNVYQSVHHIREFKLVTEHDLSP